MEMAVKMNAVNDFSRTTQFSVLWSDLAYVNPLMHDFALNECHIVYEVFQIHQFGIKFSRHTKP